MSALVSDNTVRKLNQNQTFLVELSDSVVRKFLDIQAAIQRRCLLKLEAAKRDLPGAATGQGNKC